VLDYVSVEDIGRVINPLIVIGQLFGQKPTTMFNGYGDQVASLYSGMDLRKNF